MSGASTGSWRVLAEWTACIFSGTGFSERCNHSLSWRDGTSEFWIFGGRGADGALLNDVSLFDMEQEQFSTPQTLNEAPAPRLLEGLGHAAVLLRDVLHGLLVLELLPAHLADLLLERFDQVQVVVRDVVVVILDLPKGLHECVRHDRMRVRGAGLLEDWIGSDWSHVCRPAQSYEGEHTPSRASSSAH